MTSHFQDVGHDVISRKKVPPFGEFSVSASSAIMQQRSAVPDLSYIRTCYWAKCCYCTWNVFSDLIKVLMSTTLMTLFHDAHRAKLKTLTFPRTW